MVVDGQHDPSVSIIVPTFNRRERLRRLLAGLEQPYRAGTRFEVVVAVDGATDGTDQMLATLHTSYPLRVLTQPNSGPAAARNRALEVARGDLVVFLDDDVEPVEGHLERHLAIHRRDPYAVAIGPMLAPLGTKMAPWLRWEAAMLQKQYNAMLAGRFPPTPRQFYTANASVRREHALAVGGFDERFTRAEDVEFAFRLRDRGLRFLFDPHAAVLHEPDRTFQSWLRVPYEYGRHDVLMERSHRRGFIRMAFEGWGDRHPLSRLLARWCVGHPWGLRATLTALEGAIRYAPDRLQMALCSAMFNVQYWQGIAEETGLGAAVWRGLHDRALASAGAPASGDTSRLTG